jgi:hypothetical protein
MVVDRFKTAASEAHRGSGFSYLSLSVPWAGGVKSVTRVSFLRFGRHGRTNTLCTIRCPRSAFESARGARGNDCYSKDRCDGGFPPAHGNLVQTSRRVRRCLSDDWTALVALFLRRSNSAVMEDEPVQPLGFGLPD